MQKVVSDLCKSCGLCCDGTLFSKVKARPVNPLIVKELSLDDSLGYFKLPCSCLVNTTCSIYEERPTICQDFFCKQIKLFKKNVLTQEDVRKNINELKRKAIILKNKIEEDYPEFIGFTRQELSIYLKKQEERAGVKKTRIKYKDIYLILLPINILASKFISIEFRINETKN